MKTIISKKVISIAGAIIVLASFVGVCFGVNNYFAHQSDLLALKASHQYEINKQRLYDLEKRIQIKEERYEGKAMPIDVKAEIKQLELEIEEIKMLLNNLVKKKGG